MKKEDKNYEVRKTAFDEKPRSRKYQHILNMAVRDPRTKIGETVVYGNSPQNYTRICSGVIPRFNRTMKPMRWEFSISADKTKIMIQRIA